MRIELKLAYTVKRPMSLRDYERYGINFMLKQGHQIIILDLSNVIHPNFNNPPSETLNSTDILIFRLESWNDLNNLTEILRDSDYLFLLIQSFGLSRSVLPMLRILNKSNTPYIVLAPMLVPGHTANSDRITLIQKARDSIEKFKGIDVKNSIIARMPRQLFQVPAARFAVLNGRASEKKNSLISKKTRIIRAHSWDYDSFLKSSHSTNSDEKYALFVDQFMPFHPDYSELGVSNIKPERYYPPLCELFRRVENELGFKVVIASHPRSNYEQLPDYFEGREIVSGRTPELIESCQFVIFHQSTTVGLAVMHRKPVLLIASKEMYNAQVYEKHFYESYSDELGAPLQFFDNPGSVNLDDAMRYDRRSYDRYMEKYIKCRDSAEKPYWEIVHDVLVGEQILKGKSAQIDGMEEAEN